MLYTIPSVLQIVAMWLGQKVLTKLLNKSFLKIVLNLICLPPSRYSFLI